MTLNNQWLKKPTVQTDVIIQLYQSGLSGDQIGKKVGLAKSSVTRRLTKAGVTLRQSKDYEGSTRYWLWKGEDYLPPITRKRNQRKHRKWSDAVRNRDDNTCQSCGKSPGRLHAHHIVPLEDCITLPLEFDVSNGTTLCPKCHKQKHKQINELSKH